MFGIYAMGGMDMIFEASQSSFGGWVAAIVGVAFGTAMLALGMAMIWKTTWNYLTRKRIDHKAHS